MTDSVNIPAETTCSKVVKKLINSSQRSRLDMGVLNF